MTSFIMTPTSIEYIDGFVKDLRTGQWIVPVLNFDTRYVNPYIGEIDPLNDDPRYQQRVIDYFDTKLTEKWLFNKPEFRKLLKYFKVDKTDQKGTVSLITDPEKKSDPSKFDEMDRKYIFRYIEKHFLTKRFIERVLREYVMLTRMKWYDLFNNTDNIKDLFSHKIKKLILEAIYMAGEK